MADSLETQLGKRTARVVDKKVTTLNSELEPPNLAARPQARISLMLSGCWYGKSTRATQLERSGCPIRGGLGGKKTAVEEGRVLEGPGSNRKRQEVVAEDLH